MPAFKENERNFNEKTVNSQKDVKSSPRISKLEKPLSLRPRPKQND